MDTATSLKDIKNFLKKDKRKGWKEAADAVAALAITILNIAHSRGWTQTKTANVLGAKQSEVSRMKRGQFDHFTMDRLLLYLRKLESDTEIAIRPRSISL